ncbi:MAG: peptidase M23 [Bacteroidetes bacterium]|nr:MAG: peptidase M23 [Bacteroidota bacterium]
MTGSQFKFDPENLKYASLDNSLKRRLGRIGLYAAAIIFIAILLNVLYSFFFDTPRERSIRHENEALREQYEILSQRKQMVDTVMSEVERIDKDIYRVIFETEPVDPGFYPGGGAEFQELMEAGNKEIVYYTAGRLDSLFLKKKRMQDVYVKTNYRADQYRKSLSAVPGIQPIANADLSLIASGFGYRIHPIYKIRRMHSGIDFSAPVGSPVMATAEGVVQKVIRSRRGLGNQVLINHRNGYHTLYACMDEITVRQGNSVKRGEQIGTVGDSGLSVAPHLHYEVHKDGKAQNPINFFFLELGPADYDKLIQISVMSGQSFD